MNKTEFIDLLRYYFSKAKKDDLTEILYDYEEHFRIGAEQGLTEQEIIESLGSPKDIYEAYMSEGVISERKGLLKGNIQEMVERAQESFKTTVQPQLPYMARSVSKTVILASGVLSYILTIFFWFVTPILVYLLSIVWQPITNLPPLPVISPITLAALAGFGFCGGLTFFFIGKEIMKWRNHV